MSKNKLIHVFVLILLASCQNMKSDRSNHQEDKLTESEKEIATTFSEVDSLLAMDRGAFWNEKLYGPIIIIDPETRVFYANTNSQEADFKQKGLLYTGTLPPHLNIANTARPPSHSRSLTDGYAYAKGAEVEQVYKTRQEKALPILEALFDWAREQQKQALPKSPLGKALYYLLQREKKLMIYCQHGRLQIDNNLVENSIRPLALGRKNYLFAGSHAAAQRMAMMYAFFASCKKQDINPYHWLKTVIERIPDHPINKIEELLPGPWVKDLEV